MSFLIGNKMMKEIDWTRLIIAVDDELIQEGHLPSERPFAAYRRIKERLRPHDMYAHMQHDPIFQVVDQTYKELYRSSDLHLPPMHVGAFMFRDVFFPLRIPVVYGVCTINPTDLLGDMPEIQKRWLFDDQQTGLTFFDQFIDLEDFVYGLDDLDRGGNLPDKTLEWWHLAKNQLEAAAATVLGSFNQYAVIQNCCISIELLLKGALFAKGIDEKTLASGKQGYGHDLKNLVNKTADHLPMFDREAVLFVVEQLPDYVKSRYEAKDSSRVKLGQFLMYSQFIGGEVLRQFSDRNIRANFTVAPNTNWDLTCRTFPKKAN
jgi:hypothetical protein